MSVNQSRMKRIPRSSTSALTSCGVCGRPSGGGVIAADYEIAAASSVEPAMRPGLELTERGREVAAHRRELVLDPGGARAADAALDHSARLELLHPLRQQPVGQRGDGLGDLREAHRP